MGSVKYSIRRMEIQYSAKFITAMPADSGAKCAILSLLYTPSPASAGARCAILSLLYPRARRQRGKTHQFIAIIPPRPVTAGQNASFYHRYTPAPAGSGAKCSILLPLYPRARQRRGKMHQFIAIIPPRPPAPGQDASIYRHYTPSPGDSGAKCIILSPLYPRARRQRGKM